VVALKLTETFVCFVRLVTVEDGQCTEHTDKLRTVLITEHTYL
jgi:hypothetical protein